MVVVYAMKSPDQDILILIRAIEDGRRILREFIECGPHDAMRAVERSLPSTRIRARPEPTAMNKQIQTIPTTASASTSGEFRPPSTSAGMRPTSCTSANSAKSVKAAR